MQISYAIENIRRIRTCPDIEMRPITILLGRNSAGKSTFLRSLPLIRQSLETRSSAPILWFGDLVDFGDANTAISEDSGKKEAAFRFTIRDLRGTYSTSYFEYDDYFHFRDRIHAELVKTRYVIAASGDRTVLQRIEIELPDEHIDVQFDFTLGDGTETAITVNGVQTDFLLKSYNVKAVATNLFSPPRFVDRTPEKEDSPRRTLMPHQVLTVSLSAIFRRSATRKLKDETIWRETRRVLAADRFDDPTIEKFGDNASTTTFSNLYKRLLSPYGGLFKTQVLALQRLARVFAVLDVLEDELRAYFLNVGYLEPVRAAGERFYRKQELQISEIAPNGSNFPIFLASLTARDLSDFSEWVRGLFGYGIRVEKTGGHISIKLHSGSRSINVTDTGYGVSQILPVLGIIWWGQRQGYVRRLPIARRGRLNTLAIEQPELHLHPEHQARLADAFVSGIRAAGRRDRQRQETRLVIETHSEALINRLGELIQDGRVKAGDIQIVIFSTEDDLDSPTEVNLSRFDDTGALINWPYGFFRYSKGSCLAEGVFAEVA